MVESKKGSAYLLPAGAGGRRREGRVNYYERHAPRRGLVHRFSLVNGPDPLKWLANDGRVNFIEYWEMRPGSGANFQLG